MFWLMNQAYRQRLAANELEYFNKTGHKAAVEWDKLNTKWKEYLVLNGKTYKPESLMPDAFKAKAKGWLKQAEKGVQSPSGRFAFLHIVHPRGEPLNLYQPGERVGKVRFTTNVNIPTLIEWKPGKHDATTWMSLTPSEMMTQRNGIRKATGEVVVYGLGLGWLLAQVCDKKSVKKVTVVEREREIIDWLKPKILEQYPQTSKVVDWVCQDAYEYIGQPKADDKRVHLFDIWPGYKEAPWDDKFQKLKDVLPRIWGWGDHYLRETNVRRRW